MTWCGFNETMAKGLQLFGLGLSIQTDKRATEEGVSLGNIPQIELAELDLMVKHLQDRIPFEDDSVRVRLEGVLGLTLFVRYLYREIPLWKNEQLSRKKKITAQEAFRSTIGRINLLLFDMEEHYYTELRPNYPRPKAIKLMVEWLKEYVKLKE
jgi:hypothetical protein